MYDEAGRWLGDYDATGATQQQAVWLGDAPVGLLAGAGTAQKLHYVQPDHLGTPRAVIDATRNVAIWSWEAKGEAFGNSVPNQDPDLDGTAFVFDMRFPGQRYDAASGLVYNYFRDYDPGTGRYVQSDPIGLEGGVASYEYSRSAPFSYFDLFGLKPGDCYPTADIAAANAVMEINPKSIEMDLEFYGWVYKTPNGRYSYTAPIKSGQHGGHIQQDLRPKTALGLYHTHGAESGPEWRDEELGGADIRDIYPDYAWLATPSNRILKHSSMGTKYSPTELPKPSPNNQDACSCEAPSFIDSVKLFLFGG